MKDLINKQLEIIDDANTWVRNTEAMQGEKGEKAYRTFANLRRKLNRKKLTLEDNPAAAIYGESQVGKSYLVGNLLSENRQPFQVVVSDEKKYEFVSEINPIGGGSESTSLITRFTTNVESFDPQFPVRARLLSPADLVMVLCDSYYNDIKINIDQIMSKDDLINEIQTLSQTYAHDNNQQNLLTEDDILDIHDYFESNFSTRALNIRDSGFFKAIPLFIHRVNTDNWHIIFSLLWNKNQHFTELFRNLIHQYNLLNFPSELYLPIEATLRKYGTILDVERLYEIYDQYRGPNTNYTPQTKAKILSTDNTSTTVNISKAYLCALTAELIFRLPKEVEQSKPFLINTDLLDFPGARHREEIQEMDIENNILPTLLLRGKVAYLFRKYSSSEKINILLFCHHQVQSAQSSMPEILDNWIKNMIGATPEERQDFIEKSQIPPLFVVSTKFNLDLEYNLNQDNPTDRLSMDNRWEQRFIRVLKRELFGAETFNWMDNWIAPDMSFQNIYLLRDFYYSSEEKGQIYEGYNTEKEELSEIKPENYPEFRNDLKDSFLNHVFVKKYFQDPNKSWDRVVKMNEDGSDYIISNLKIAAQNINQAREARNRKDLSDIQQNILDELKKYYHDSDSDIRLIKARRKAGDLQRDLDIAFGRNPYFFGLMLKEMMLNESQVYKLFHKEIHSIEDHTINNNDQYTGIRVNVPGLNSKDSFEENLERLRIHYEMSNLDECRKSFEARGIDLNELFYGETIRVKQSSQILAERLESYWLDEHLRHNSSRCESILTESSWHDFQDMLKTLFSKLEITRKIGERIRHYIDGNRKNIEESYGMIADISAEIINNFILSVGQEYFSDTEINDLYAANESNNLGLVLDHSDLEYGINGLSEVAEILNRIENLPELLNQEQLPLDVRRLPNFSNYIKWYDSVKVGFVAVCDIPNYDTRANENLRVIIENCKNIYPA